MNKKIEVTDVSRRKLLKKAYVAPVVVALGSMAFTADANAGGFGAYHKKSPGAHHSGGSSSSLSGGSGWCGMCKKSGPCSHHP